jgi:gliding motility-associated-like protein
VTGISITDPDDTTINAIYIQVSSGYQSTQDQLSLSGVHPNVVASWNAVTGKLTLQSPVGLPVAYSDFVDAIQDVVYTNSASNASGTRGFSITVGQANYLPSNGHYYQFISAVGITWTAAKVAAEASLYYGLQGYLATVTAADEAQITGEQASGAGWIGGSDEATEGVWKWMTGPEASTTFWNGNASGSTPNFAFWNTSEPNNLGDEHYAHVTAPGVGIPGSWNDLPLAGSGGDYQPKGYIVEYGGMADDPEINIAAGTTMTIAEITETVPTSTCGSGQVTLSATSNTGTVNWYASPSGTTVLHSGNDFTTPNLTSTTTFYVDSGCSGSTRTPIVATINNIPTLTVTPPPPSCEGSMTLSATASSGTVSWFESAAGGTAIATGPTFTTPVISETTTYYAEAATVDCISATRIAVTAVIFNKPNVEDEVLPLCENSTLTLDAALTGHSFLWQHSQETTRTVVVTEPGVYTVAVTSPAPQNCTAIKTITVVEKFAPVIESVTVEGNLVTINMSNSGDFEYSIDGENFQISNVFQVNEPGLHTAYVGETNYCGNDNENFIVLVVPAFFSPNEDMFNDYWTIKGVENYPSALISIYDRYGKLVSQLSQENPLWDGKHNRRKLPASDYWFVLSIQGKSEIRGHFSLIR